MQFEFRTPGKGIGTTLTINGEKVRGAFKVEFSHEAGGIPFVRVHANCLDENGKFFLIGEDDDLRVATEIRCFTGSVSLTGDLKEIIDPETPT